MSPRAGAAIAAALGALALLPVPVRAVEADWVRPGNAYRYLEPTEDLGGAGGPGARFRGRTTLQGRYVFTGEERGCGSALVFEPSPQALERLPRHRTDGAPRELWFADESAALRALGLERAASRIDGFERCSAEGAATIEIGDLESSVDCDRRWYSARLIGASAAAPAFGRCGLMRCTVNDPTGTPLNVRESAGAAEPVVHRLDNGTPVNLIHEGRGRDERGWAYVEWKDGDTVRGGWVFRNYLSACAR